MRLLKNGLIRVENLYAMKTCIQLFLLLLFSASASSFSIDNHKTINDLVEKEYLKLPQYHSMSKEMWKAFKKGNIEEDSKYLRKRKNWHFYDPTFTFNLEESLNRRFKELIDTLNKQINDKADIVVIYKTLGGITHYLQDMVVPPHVVPVYHGGSDAFDEYKISKKGQYASIINEVKLKSVNDTSFYDLLNEYAQLTLTSIKDSITISEDGVNKKITWNWFWESSSIVSFGQYGRLDNNFGKTTFRNRKACYLKNRKYFVCADYYCSFHEARVIAAKDASLRALLLLDKLLKQRDTLIKSK